MRKLDHATFMERSRARHGDSYEYPEPYAGNHTKIRIVCKVHGDFFQTPVNHWRHGCQKCAALVNGAKQTLSKEEFLKRLEAFPHLELLSEFRGITENVTMNCTEHGEFTRLADEVVRSPKGCPRCGIKLRTACFPATKAEFVIKAGRIHKDIYGYPYDDYSNSKEKLVIVCQKHGEFSQTPDNHLQGRGCPKCQASHGELEVESALNKLGLPFQREFKIPECKNILPLPFDFAVFLEGVTYLIEYQGKQHYEVPNYYYGGEKAFASVQLRDRIKSEYCAVNNVPLLTIPHWEFDNIESLITEFLKK